MENLYKKALNAVGPIEPLWDEEAQVWRFASPLFPECDIYSDSREEVLTKYPKYLKLHLKDYLDNRLPDWIVQSTPGWGGKRPGAGRPRGSTKGPTQRITVPADIADALNALGTEKARKVLKQALSS